MNEHRFATIRGSGAVRRIALENELNTTIEAAWEAITDVDQVKQH